MVTTGTGADAVGVLVAVLDVVLDALFNVPLGDALDGGSSLSGSGSPGANIYVDCSASFRCCCNDTVEFWCR